MCLQAGGLGDRLAESAASATDPLARQGAFESYTALMKDIGAPIEPFVAGVLSTMLDKCSDKVRDIIHNHLCAVAASIPLRLYLVYCCFNFLACRLFGLHVVFWCPVCQCSCGLNCLVATLQSDVNPQLHWQVGRCPEDLR